MEKSKTDYINAWIDFALTKTKGINKSISSYGLKHICERSLGTYVSNEEIKDAMKKKGFIGFDYGTKYNLYYNISKVINRVTFDIRLENMYKNGNIYDFHKRSKDIFIETKTL